MLAAACTLLALLALPPLSRAERDKRSHVPGTFYWHPRVGLNIAMPTLRSRAAQKPTWRNIHAGYVVMVDGYQAGVTVAALASYLEDVRDAFPHLHPGKAHYYTNAYRWLVRHISLIPDWLGGKRSSYVSTHKVWKKRYYYLNYFLPKWVRKVLFFVDDESWKYEEWEWKKFEKYAEPHFSKYYRYPSKRFNNFNSMRQDITVENLDVTNNSIDN